MRPGLPGARWLMLESDSGGIGIAQRFPSESGVFDEFEEKLRLKGRSLREVASLMKSWNLQEAAVGMTALNAACNTMTLVPQSPLREAVDKAKGCAFDMFLPRIKGKKVTVVGHFPHLDRLSAHCTLSILERRPRSGDLPDMAAEYILPEQDAVFITGTTFTNKTITRLLELTKGADVYMVGPSTPMNPLLFKHGVTSLSGLVVSDRAGVAEAIRTDCCEDIFRRGGVKVNMMREDV